MNWDQSPEKATCSVRRPRPNRRGAFDWLSSCGKVTHMEQSITDGWIKVSWHLCVQTNTVRLNNLPPPHTDTPRHPHLCWDGPAWVHLQVLRRLSSGWLMESNNNWADWLDIKQIMSWMGCYWAVTGMWYWLDSCLGLDFSFSCFVVVRQGF